MNSFTNRAFGAVIVKSINSNFNADFTKSPRTLPDGTIYATDKALKYTIKDQFKKLYPNEKIFYFKSYNVELQPRSLDESYISLFGEFPTGGKKGKGEDVVKIDVLNNLFECLDVRLFGATFAGKTNISIHGALQINHGVNRFNKNEIYTEDILSPFRNSNEKSSESQMSTKGTQTNVQEAHYVYHLSLNPYNHSVYGKGNVITLDDIDKLKLALRSSVTMLDSSRKIGSENEAFLWVQLKNGSFKVLPSFTELITIKKEDNVILDLAQVTKVLNEVSEDIDIAEFYYNPVGTEIRGYEGGNIKLHSLLNGKPLE